MAVNNNQIMAKPSKQDGQANGSVFSRVIMAFAGLMLVAAGTVAASANDAVFVVPRVPVSAEAESALAAKRDAELQGRREAMDILLRRLAPQEDWDYLPRLARGELAPKSDGYEAIENPYNAQPGGDPAQQGTQEQIAQGILTPRGKTAISLDDDQLRRLEQSFEVYDEKSSPTTYRAFMTYRFKPDETRNLLITAGIPYSEAQTRMALVLPVLETDRGLYLWEQNNPWLNAWQARPLGYELTPMTAPLGDLEDTTSLTAQEAMALDQDKLDALATRYGVTQVIIAHARLSQRNGEDQVRVRLINGLRESGALSANPDAYPAGEALDQLSQGASRRLRDADSGRSPLPVGPYGADGIQTREPGDVLSEVRLSEPSGNFPALADRSIVSSVNKYAAAWKAQTLIDHSVSTVLRATAFFRSLGEWKRIRGALISTPLVGSVQIRNLSREGAEMSIQAFGDPGKLVIAMESQGVSLWTYNQGPIDQSVWNLATPETAAIVPVRVQRAPVQERRRFRRSRARSSNDGWDGAPWETDPVTGQPIQRVNEFGEPVDPVPAKAQSPYQ